MKSENLITVALVLIIAGLVAYKVVNRPEKTGPTTNPSGTSEEQATAIGQLLNENGFLGKVTAIQFGRIDCENSGRDLELLTQWSRDNALPGLNYARVEFSKDAQAVTEFYKKNDPGFPIIRDPSGEIGQVFGATIIPSLVLIDKYGHIRYRGHVPRKRIDTWTELLVAEKSDPGPDAIMFGVEDIDVAKLVAKTSLPGADGSPATPLNTHMGETGLMLVFVDTKCPFAEQAIKEIPDTAPVLKKQKINTVLINIDDDEETVTSFYKNRNLGVPVVFDKDSSTHVSWNVYSVPRVFVISQKKELVYSGNAAWKNVFASIEENLAPAEEPVTPPHNGTGFG